MTALNFIINNDSVIISMDTMCLRADNKAPYKYVSKFLPLPHMNCVICGTGDMNSIIDWFRYVLTNVIGNGIFQLDKVSGQVLPRFMEEHNILDSCTIYQFGLHEIDDIFHGYAYRSTNSFLSEEISQGIGIKPPDAFIDIDGQFDLRAIGEGLSIEETLIKIMQIQKENDQKLPVLDRLGIGGKIQVLYLTRDAILIKDISCFVDYKDNYVQMLKNL